jgi:hypothetical protein
MDQDKNRAVNSLLMRVARRADKSTPEYLAETFVPVDPVPALLNSVDNQIIYGRRGTGKTHLLQYFAEARKGEGDVALYIDLNTIGSSSTYSDPSQPATERATYLLIDLVEQIHNQLWDLLDTEIFNEMLDEIIPSLNAIGDAATQVKVIGSTESAITVGAGVEDNDEAGITLNFNGTVPSLKANAGRRRKRSKNISQSRKQSGTEIASVYFGPLGRALSSLLRAMKGYHLWLLLDEWSNGVPRDLQPYFADLLRRIFFPVPGISVKIAALMYQSDFRVNVDGNRQYLGIDLGADTAASLDLDDFLVLQSNRTHALAFFSQLIYQHVSVLMATLGYDFTISTAAEFQQLAFTGTAFDELVRASEGVPRDALNIAGLAGASANDKPITTEDIRRAARTYFLRDKEGRIGSKARRQLDEFVEDCVQTGTRCLVLRRGSQSSRPSIQQLYDNRLIHRIAQGVILDDDYSTKYDLYLVDFGCFINLLARGNAYTVNDGTDVLRVAESGHIGLRSSWVAQPRQARWRSAELLGRTLKSQLDRHGRPPSLRAALQDVAWALGACPCRPSTRLAL